MPIIERVVAALVAAIIAIAVGGGNDSSPVAYPTNIPIVVEVTAAPAPQPTSAVETTSTVTATSEVVETIEPRYDIPKLAGIEKALCPDWWQLAVEVGWAEEQLPTVDRIMWNETRCQADAVSPTRDYGLMQINRSVWESTAAEHGWTMEDLLIPANGLAMGLVVYNAAEAMGWCGFQPWYMSGSYCR